MGTACADCEPQLLARNWQRRTQVDPKVIAFLEGNLTASVNATIEQRACRDESRRGQRRVEVLDRLWRC